MAIVIEPFQHQNIPISTPFSLDVPVSGNPRDVSVDGRIKGFYYNWTGAAVELRGTPEVLAENVPLVIRADDVSYTQTFTIHPIVPVIGPLSTVSVRRGVAINIPIPITGHVSDFRVRGPWIGLRHGLTDDLDGELYGTIPAESIAELTHREFSFRIEAYNGDVFASAILNLEFEV